jgi:hypothetical protein
MGENEDFGSYFWPQTTLFVKIMASFGASPGAQILALVRALVSYWLPLSGTKQHCLPQ